MAKVVLVALILVVVGPFLPTAASARTIWVGTDCDTGSIAAAVKMANAGDRLFIKKGVYRENEIVIDRTLEIIGQGMPELDGQNKHPVMRIKADGVRISGLVIRNTGISYLEDRAGIRLDRVTDGIIEDCVFRNNLFSIYLANCKKCRIRNNRIVGQAVSEGSAGNGIHLWHCKEIEVFGNQLSHHRDGIYLEFVDDSRILRNLCRENLRYGLHFMFSNGDLYRSNTFCDNGAGVAVMYSRRVDMLENLFSYNWGAASYGLLAKDLDDSEISKNVFYRNTTGLQCDGTNRISIGGNDFIENGRALRISSHCADAVFAHNNFIGNTFDLVSEIALASIQFRRNFWDDMNGYDLDCDGISDKPYRPVKLSSLILDNYPGASILLRSPLFELLDLIERALPAVSHCDLLDSEPLMRKR